ncbi:Sodium channel protein Nach [Frankliniella fusca]|uniref:Sodium channel protein Nach n=1 Tax=Frankliniella fusca TaxID=407009 RepID=A0AAE1LEL7_9NEOP|nr:Sodium channel protein Nach [Frankliniella fusca]
MTHIMSRNFYPIKITVVDTRVDVRDYPFPSVTVCPVANIQKSVALASLRLYYKIDRRRGGRGPVPPNASAQGKGQRIQNRGALSDFEDFVSRALPEEDVDLAALERLHVRALRTLQDFRFPLYSSKWTGLDVEPLESLGTMDPRELLLMALPTCQQLFIYCTWNNKVSDCCDLFEVQETNAGLCYAFNSCTSMTAKTDRCHPRSGEPEETRAMYVSTVKAEPSEVLSEDPHARGIVVVIANPYEFPVPSNGYYFPEDGSINMLTVTQSLSLLDFTP